MMTEKSLNQGCTT